MFRTPALAALTGASLLCLAVPASAHASFPSSPTFGFAPNTAGGTGATSTVAPPYAAGVTTQVFARVPYEQTTPSNGAPDTTVDVRVVVPAGWTSPTCGAARTVLNDSTTNSTNQPGTAVPGWTCELLTVDGHPVLHWAGPQVGPTQTPADSAQFFVFGITAPSPAVQTSYNGLDGTEGFVIDQTYASGEVHHWIPNAAYPGTPPAGATTSVAGGLVRTVAAAPVVAPPVVVPPVVETPTAPPAPTAPAVPAVAAVPPAVTRLSAARLVLGDTLDVTVTGTPGTRVDLKAVFGPWAATRNLRTAVVPASGVVTFTGLEPRTTLRLWVAERRGAASAPVTVRVSR